MAGPFDIQRAPIGLLDLFGLKATGDSPHLLEPAVSSVIEVGNLYTIDRMLFDFRATAVAPVATGYLGLSLNTGPPPGALWMLYSASLQLAQIAPATAIGITPVIRRGGVAVYEALAPTIQRGADQGGMSGGLYYGAPILMRPGDELGTFVNSITGAVATTAIMSYSYVQLLR